MTKKTWLANLALVAGSIILGLAVVELAGLVLYYFKSGELFYTRQQDTTFIIDDPDLGFRPRPNLHIRRPQPEGLPNAPRRKSGYNVDTDSHGFRYLGDLGPEKAPDEIRIFCLGGSTTQSTEVPNEWSYPQQLNDMFADKSVKVINAGSGGYRSIHMLRYYQKFIRPLKPDVVTLYEGWNDYEDFLYSYWKPKYPQGNSQLSQQIMMGSTLSRFVLGRALVRMYFELRNYNRVEVTGNDEAMARKYYDEASNPLWHEEYASNFRELIDEVRSDGAVPVLIIFPSTMFPDAPPEAKGYADRDINMNGRWDAYVLALGHIRRILHELAEKNDVLLIDANAPFDAYNNDYKKKFQLFTDRMHLMKEGNRLIAEAMYGPLRSVVEQIRRGRNLHVSR